jgi:hypothetical protein
MNNLPGKSIHFSFKKTVTSTHHIIAFVQNVQNRQIQRQEADLLFTGVEEGKRGMGNNLVNRQGIYFWANISVLELYYDNSCIQHCNPKII